MSNSLAIAAVTATLQRMLTSTSGGLTANLPADLPGSLNLSSVNVTTKPLDKARAANDNTNQLNIYLYQTEPNAALRNMDMQRKMRPGETALPPVALTLHYLLSAYGQNDDETAAHILLGQAMRIFHDNAVLDQTAIRDAIAGNDLHEQVERVRITPQPLTLEEISKLWTAFQTQYRISAAYQAEVVLIESNRQSRTPLPVLMRGPEDRGVAAVAGNNLPTIEGVHLPNRQSSAFLGDELVIVGQNLNDLAGVRFAVFNPELPDAPSILLPPAATQMVDEGIKVTLPNDAAAKTLWAAGFYTLAVVVNREVNGTPQTWSSNELALSLAPRIESIAPANVVARDAAGNVTLTLTCSPEVKLAMVDPTQMRFDQQVALLLGTARQIMPESPPPPLDPAAPPPSTNTLTFLFHVGVNELGTYLVRVRVDGVDLPLVDRTVTPPQFHASQKVTIT